MCKISIIIPVYQVSSYLERCINSVLDQSYSNYEVILIDDGSTDGSSEICDLYSEKYRNFYTIHKENGGLSSARNAGLRIARGDYLFFLDSDDLIHRDTLKIELSLLEKTGADAVICPFQKFSEIDEINLSSEVGLFDITIISGIEAEKRFFSSLDPSKYVSVCGHLFKRNLFSDITFPKGRLFEDEYVSYKVYYKSKKITIIDKSMYFYYINSSGITQNLNAIKRCDEYDARFERILFFKENNENELYQLALLNFLKDAQWLLTSKNLKDQTSDEASIKRLFSQFRYVLNEAEKANIISFADNFDFYIIAFPERRIRYRVRRIALKIINKLEITLVHKT